MPADPSEVIESKADVMGGSPVFAGTRVPIQTLLDCLCGGHPLDEFLDDFPTVKREQAVGLLEYAKILLLQSAGSPG